MANKINIAQLEEYLKQAGLENGKLEEVLEPIKELNNQRRYGLVWEEPDNSTYNTDSAEHELLKNFPFLKEVNEHRIFNGEQHPDHLLIEGDNLHALKTMQYTHKNKIDVIYIDPPYNTGNTDFVYNDKYVGNEDSWRHSKWLSFMNKRLRLARELMTDEGVIFISIDDNEQAQLKLLCDQIFGESNFIANVIWNNASRNTSNTINLNHEYVLIYAKDSKVLNKFESVIDKNSIRMMYDHIKDCDSPEEAEKVLKGLTSELKKNDQTKHLTNYSNVDKDGRIFYAVDLSTPSKPNRRVLKDGTILEPLRNRGWQSEERINSLLDKGLIQYKSGRPYAKKFIDDLTEVNTSIVRIFTRQGVEEVQKILGSKKFDFPKPVRLITHFLKMIPNKNAVVLDFFAGSGTTAHAVMELNEEDGGNRQAIVITNNEINSTEEEDLLVEKGYVEPFTGSRRGTKKHAEWLEKVNEFKTTPEYLEFIETDEYKDLGIARAVTEQRINKVINGYTTPRGKEVGGLTDNNFYHFDIVLEPDLLDMDLNTYVLVNKTKDIIRIKEGVYTKEEDISTETVPSVKLTGKDKEVIVVLSVRVTDADIEGLVNNFKYSEKEHVIYTSYTGFEYGINNIRFEELPKELLQAIKHEEGM